MELENIKRIIYALIEETQHNISKSREFEILNECLTKLGEIE